MPTQFAIAAYLLLTYTDSDPWPWVTLDAAIAAHGRDVVAGWLLEVARDNGLPLDEPEKLLRAQAMTSMSCENAA